MVVYWEVEFQANLVAILYREANYLQLAIKFKVVIIKLNQLWEAINYKAREYHHMEVNHKP